MGGMGEPPPPLKQALGRREGDSPMGGPPGSTPHLQTTPLKHPTQAAPGR